MLLSLLDLLRHEMGGRFLAEAAPALDIADQGDHLLLRAPLRGIDPKSVQIHLTGNGLAIGGRRTVEERTEGPDYRLHQASVSQFFREMRLPCTVDPRRAAARWESDGTLLLVLPKA